MLFILYRLPGLFLDYDNPQQKDHIAIAVLLVLGPSKSCVWNYVLVRPWLLHLILTLYHDSSLAWLKGTFIGNPQMAHGKSHGFLQIVPSANLAVEMPLPKVIIVVAIIKIAIVIVIKVITTIIVTIIIIIVILIVLIIRLILMILVILIITINDNQ